MIPNWARHGPLRSSRLKQLSIRSGIVIPATAATNAAYWSLRIGSGLCFIGHGAFGIITKREWLPYFAVVGIPADWAFSLMPLIGPWTSPSAS